MKICFATNNENKIKEVKKMLPDHIDIVSLNDIGCNEELLEDQDTLEGNARQKAEYVFRNYHVACFADDTGLEVSAINGEPGVKSARYAGDHRSNEDNISLLLTKLKDESDTSAQFRTVISLFLNEDEVQFEGVVKGEIISEKSGSDGFGYDPVFRPEGYNVTFAEMSMAEKNKISHRGLAVNKLIEYLTQI